MITGRERARFTAHTGDDKPYAVRIIEPDKTPPNIAELRRQGVRDWDRYVARYQNKRLSTDIVDRAKFAGNVMFFAAAQLTTPAKHRVLLALHGDEVVGVAIYQVRGALGYLHWVAIHPRYLAGTGAQPSEQVRGIGSSMVCAASEVMAEAGATTLELTPLDDEAERFWKARGFRPAEGDHLRVSGREAVAALAGACSREPDDPARGDCVACGTVPTLKAAQAMLWSTRR